MPAEENDQSLLIVTTYRVHPEDAGAFKAITERMAVDARRREDNRFLLAAQDIQNPAIFHLTEGWKDQQSVDEHIAGDDFKAVLVQAQELRIEDRTAKVYGAILKYELGMPT